MMTVLTCRDGLGLGVVCDFLVALNDDIVNINAALGTMDFNLLLVTALALGHAMLLCRLGYEAHSCHARNGKK